MIRDDVCYLLAETPGTHGVFDAPAYTERMVFCSVRSVSSADFWRAYQQGIEPRFVFVLSDPIEYQGEKLLRYGSTRFRVVRTYTNSASEIEITVEAAKAYVGQPENGA